MNWLFENKEWIFSGIGVLILTIIGTGIVALLKRRSSTTKTIMTSAVPTSTVPALTKKMSSHRILTIKEILQDIRNAPPYQRDDTKMNYHGVRIRFPGVLDFIWKRENDIVRINIIDPKTRHYDVSFEISIKEYPEFKTMRTNTPLVVEGTLVDIDYGSCPFAEMKMTFANYFPKRRFGYHFRKIVAKKTQKPPKIKLW